MRNVFVKSIEIGLLVFALAFGTGCGKQPVPVREPLPEVSAESLDIFPSSGGQKVEKDSQESVEAEQIQEETERIQEETEQSQETLEPQVIQWNETWEFAEYSKLHSDAATLYYSETNERKNVTVAVNAGHGTEGGHLIKTLCHPDGSPKVTGGSTAKGSTEAGCVSRGTTLLDGTREPVITLSLALLLKQELLDRGYDVLMIREAEDVQIDNVARTVYANNNADCHIALHYNSTDYDAGFFYIGVPDVESYRSMEPVASHWTEHIALGEAILAGMKKAKIKIWEEGVEDVDLTQTSYSTIPSVDVEVGDRASDYSADTQGKIAQAIADGVEIWHNSLNLTDISSQISD